MKINYVLEFWACLYYCTLLGVGVDVCKVLLQPLIFEKKTTYPTSLKLSKLAQCHYVTLYNKFYNPENNINKIIRLKFRA